MKDDVLPEDERAEFTARPVCVLDCQPGNYDSPDGDPASIITLSDRRGLVCPWAISAADSRLLAVKLLVSLASQGDEFAQKVLDDEFPADEQGHFIWPR